MPTRRLTQSEIADVFTEHRHVINATRSWAQGQLTDQEFLKCLHALKDFLDTTPVEFEEEECWEAG